MTSTESDMKKIPWIDSSERLPKKGEIALIAYDNVFTKSEEYDVVTIEDNSVNYPLWVSIIGSGTYASYQIKRWILLKYTREDCINREELDEIKEPMTDINGDTVYAVRMSDIRHLPPVTPQRPQGKWIEIFVETPNDPYNYGFKSHKCSKCGNRPLQISDYCPNCGAEMNGGEE